MVPGVKLGPIWKVTNEIHRLGIVVIDKSSVHAQKLKLADVLSRVGIVNHAHIARPKGKWHVQVLAGYRRFEAACRNAGPNNRIASGWVVLSIEPKCAWKMTKKGNEGVSERCPGVQPFAVQWHKAPL